MLTKASLEGGVNYEATNSSVDTYGSLYRGACHYSCTKIYGGDMKPEDRLLEEIKATIDKALKDDPQLELRVWRGHWEDILPLVIAKATSIIRAEIDELKEELRVGNLLTAKLTDKCRELEAIRAERLDDSGYWYKGVRYASFDDFIFGNPSSVILKRAKRLDGPKFNNALEADAHNWDTREVVEGIFEFLASVGVSIEYDKNGEMEYVRYPNEEGGKTSHFPDRQALKASKGRGGK